MSKTKSIPSNKRKSVPAPQHREPGSLPSHTRQEENPDKIDYISNPGRCGLDEITRNRH